MTVLKGQPIITKGSKKDKEREEEKKNQHKRKKREKEKKRSNSIITGRKKHKLSQINRECVGLKVSSTKRS
jgi:hypothetical protein